jgi:hypothetical protein
MLKASENTRHPGLLGSSQNPSLATSFINPKRKNKNKNEASN